jgi:RNase P subunit RPR2
MDDNTATVKAETCPVCEGPLTEYHLCHEYIRTAQAHNNHKAQTECSCHRCTSLARLILSQRWEAKIEALEAALAANDPTAAR